ncbi:MAG: hypothetical protein HY897_16420 [Deltaproteobacteria bacterium]|nr:hypothetical protein [Deltaproteobacteria bacterium]
MTTREKGEPMRAFRRGQEGITVVAVIVYIALVAAAYLSYLYVPIFWRQYCIKETLEGIANLSYSQRNDEVLRMKCVQLMKEKADLVVQTNDCRIERSKAMSTTTVAYTYNETVRFFPTDYKVHYTFEMSFTQDMKAHKW